MSIFKAINIDIQQLMKQPIMVKNFTEFSIVTTVCVKVDFKVRPTHILRGFM